MNTRLNVHLVIGTVLALFLVTFATGSLTAASSLGETPPPTALDQSATSARRMPLFGSDFLISTADGGPAHAAIAINTSPGQDEFLLVYAKDAPFDLYGQIFTTEGAPIGESFLISDARDHQYDAAVAYNPAVTEYLVVWTDRRLGSQTDIMARRVDADGTLVGTEFAVSDAPDWQTDPAITYNPVTREYMVVWSDDRDSATAGTNIYGQRVYYDGTLGGSAWSLTSSAADRVAADLVCNSKNREYLIVWENRFNGDANIVGQMLAFDGTLKGAPRTINPAQESNQSLPTVAWDSHNDLYLVIWEDDTTSDATGLRLEGSLVHKDWSWIQDFSVFDATGDQRHPDLVHNQQAEEYLVVWEDGRDGATAGIDVYGMRLTAHCISAPAECLPKRVGGGDFVISQAAYDQTAPVVVYSKASAQYVVGWQDQRSTGSDGSRPGGLYAQRVWWPGLLLGDDFALDAATGSQDRPAAAYSSLNHEYLIVWADERNGDADIYARLYNDEGLPLTESLAVHQETGDQVLPAVAFNPNANSYLVVWENQTQGTIEGRALNFRGSPLGPVHTIASGTPPKANPVVAFNPFPNYNDYLVVFEASLDDTDIHGQRAMSSGYSRGSEFAIGEGRGHQQAPDIVFNPEAEEYLVVWQDDRHDDPDIFAQRVGPTAILLDVPIEVAQQIGSAEAEPTVTHSPLDNRYLVAWHQTQPGETQGTIQAQLLEEFGQHVGASFAVAPSGPVQSLPDAVFVTGLERYHVVWQDNRHGTTGPDIYGQWLARDGTPLIPSGQLVFRYHGWQERPVVVAGTHQGSSTPQILTIWQDWRSNADTDIYAQLSSLDILPPVARFTRDPSRGRLGTIFVFNARPSHDNATPRGLLQAQWDLDDDGNYDTELGTQKMVTHTFTQTGVHTVTLMVKDIAGLTDTLSLQVFVRPLVVPTILTPEIAASERPTASLTLSPTTIVAGQSIRLDASASEGTGDINVRWDWENDGTFDTDFSTVVTATHVYTVSGVQTARVEALDATGLTSAALHNVTLLPGTVTALKITPIVASLIPGAAVQMSAMAWDTYDNRMQHPVTTWSLAEGISGTIDAGGVFTAGMEAGTYPDAVIAASSAMTGTGSVTIFWPRQVYMPLNLRH